MSLSEFSPADLNDLKNGKSRALKKLFTLHYQEIYQFAFLFLEAVPHVGPDDIATEVFSAVWEDKYKIVDIDHLKRWLWRVTRNKCLNVLRQYKATPEKTKDPNTLPDPIVLKTPKEEEEEFNASINKLYQKLDQLPALEADVLRMKYLEHRTTTEIAKQLNITENYVYLLIYRGLNHLRELWKKPLF